MLSEKPFVADDPGDWEDQLFRFSDEQAYLVRARAKLAMIEALLK